MYKDKNKQREHYRAYYRTYYSQNGERYRGYRAKRKEQQKVYQQKYREEHREKRLLNMSNYHKTHKEVHNSRDREYWKVNKQIIAIRRRNRAYGVTSEQVVSQFQKQGGKCAICRKVLDPNGTRSTKDYVDHNHITQKFRGLLCITCNMGLGAFHDSIELLKAAIAYLSGDV